MTYRVIQWATGDTGKQALRLALDHPDLEVVGGYVFSEDKDGVDIGSLVGREEIGVRATRDKEAILALKADCVLHNVRNKPDLSPSDADVVALLESGKNVISVV